MLLHLDLRPGVSQPATLPLNSPGKTETRPVTRKTAFWLINYETSMWRIIRKFKSHFYRELSITLSISACGTHIFFQFKPTPKCETFSVHLLRKYLLRGLNRLFIFFLFVRRTNYQRKFIFCVLSARPHHVSDCVRHFEFVWKASFFFYVHKISSQELKKLFACLLKYIKLDVERLKLFFYFILSTVIV